MSNLKVKSLVCRKKPAAGGGGGKSKEAVADAQRKGAAVTSFAYDLLVTEEGKARLKISPDNKHARSKWHMIHICHALSVYLLRDFHVDRWKL